MRPLFLFFICHFFYFLFDQNTMRHLFFVHFKHKNADILILTFGNQRTNGPLNAHLISWPSKAQNMQNLENIW